MELSSLIFSATTTDLERASTVIASLVQDMSRVSVASANMARISAQTEQILARAATESAKARKENARAADIEIKTIIAADKADAERAESIRKAAEAERRRTEGTEEGTRAAQRNVSILQRQSDILEFQAQGWSKGQSSILATAKAAEIAADEMEKLQKVLETQRKLMGSDPFDKSMSGLTSLKNQYGELRESIRQYRTDSDLTSKQTKELARDKERLIEKMKTENASFSEIRNAVRAYNTEYVNLAGQYNNLAQAEADVIKNRKAVASATDYLTQADQKLAAALDTSNTAIDRSGTDLLVKYEAALRKSGVAQDVATQKLAAYKTQLVQVQDQEQKRREDHLTRGLAPQATDIVVSLWSGQNPLTVLLQQGGQISDMFIQSGVAAEDFAKVVRSSLASMVPAMMTVATGIAEVIGGVFVDAGKSIIDFINLVPGVTEAYDLAKSVAESVGISSQTFATTMSFVGNIAGGIFAVGLAAAAASVVALGIAVVQAITENNRLAVQLGQTGAAMGITFDRAMDLSTGMQNIGVSTSDALRVMVAMAKEGGFTADEVRKVTKSAVELETYGGVAIESTIKSFAKMKGEPVDAMFELAKSTGLVTTETIKSIMEMEEQGRIADSTAIAITELARVNDEQVSRMKSSYNGFSLFMIDLGKGISKFFSDAFKDLFYNASPKAQLKSQLKAINETLNAWGTMDMSAAGAIQAMIPGEKERVELQRAQVLNKIRLINMEEQEYEAGQKRNQQQVEMLRLEQGVTDELDKQGVKRAKKGASLADFTKIFVAEKVKDAATSTRIDANIIIMNDALISSYKELAKVEWESSQKKSNKSENYYNTLMREATNNTIEADNAVNRLTKSELKLLEVRADPRFKSLSSLEKNNIEVKYQSAIASEKQKEAVIDLQKAEEFRDKILGKSEGLGKDYYAQMEALPKHAANLKLTTEQTDELIRKIYQGTPVWQQYNKSLEQVDEALRKFTESSIAYQASTNAENQELNHRISLLGKTAEEQRKLQIEYQREMKINATRVELEKKLRDITKERAEAEGNGIRDTKKLQEFTDAEVQARRDAAERIKVINKGVAVEYASDLDKEIAAVKQGISDSIVTALFEGGKEGSKKLRSVLVDVLRKKVTIVVDAVVNTLVGNVIGSITGGASGGIGGVASGIQTASNLNSIWGTASQAMYGASAGASMASLGYANAVGMVGGDAIGALAAANGMWAGVATGAQAAAQSAIAANVALEAGTAVALEAGTLSAAGGTAAGGFTAALQAIPGWGWALAGVALLAGTMDFGGEQRFGGGYQLNGNKEVKYTAGPGGGQINQEAQEAVVNETYKSVNSILKSLGSTLEVVDFYAGLETSGKGKGGTFAGGKLSSGTEFGKKWQAGMYSQDLTAEEAVNQFAGQMKIVTVEALKAATDIPVYLQDELKKVDVAKLTGDTAGLVLEETNRMYTQFSTVTGALELLNKPMFDTTTAGYALTETFIEMFGGIEGLKTSVSSYYDNFYSEAEKELNIRNQLTAALDEQNLALPKTRDEYRNLVEAQDLTTEAGRKNYAVLLQNASAFAIITDASERYKDILMSSADKTAEANSKVAAEFANLGIAVPKTRADLLKLIQQQEALGKSGADTANKLKAIAPAFEEVTASAEGLLGSVGINTSSLKDGIRDFLLGRVKPEDMESAGKAIVDMVKDGIYNAVADSFVNQITELMTGSVITPIIQAAITGASITEAVSQSAIDNMVAQAQAAATALGQVLNNPEFKAAINSIEAAISSVLGAGSSSSEGSGGSSGESRSVFGGSAVRHQSPELEAFDKLATETIASNDKVSELLKNLLNPKKDYENRYLELAEKLAEKQTEYNVSGRKEQITSAFDVLVSSINPNYVEARSSDPGQVNWGISFSDSAVSALVDKIAENTGRDAGDIAGEISDLISGLGGTGSLDKLSEYIRRMLNGVSGITDIDLSTKVKDLENLEKGLREWYLAQARVIAIEDLTSLASETKQATAKTAELKRTGGLEDPVTKLKESLASKMKVIDEGIGAALLAEVEILKGQKVDTSKLESVLSTQTGLRDKLTAEGYLDSQTTYLTNTLSQMDSNRILNEQAASDLQAAWGSSVGTENEAYAASAYNNHISAMIYLNEQYSWFEGEMARLSNGGLTDDINAINTAITKTEEELTAAILAATNPAKQQELLDEIALYKGGITEWYKAQAELLSTEMLVDINKQIRELEASEKGPLTTIKDAIQKYIDDFKALGTLTDDIQTQIDKLSGLQLTKARKSLYDQLLSPDEVKLRDSYDLNIEFAKLGKTVPTTTQGLRDMIDAANAAGNVTLADSLLELVPAFLALQEGAEGVSAVLEGLRSDTDEAYAALERAVEAQRKVLNETIANLKAVFDAAKNAAKTLYGEVDSVKKQSAAAGNAFINQALQELKSTGIVPDGIKLQDAIDSAMQGLSTEVYDSSFEEQRGRLILAGKLTTIADLTEPQLTVAEKQLKDLDLILENARQQIDELRGINNSVLSVVDAIANLAAAIALEKAQTPVAAQQGWNPNDMVYIPGKEVGTGGTGVVAPTKTNAERTIASLYQQVLGREADATGMQWYLDNYSSGGNLTVDAHTFENILDAGRTGTDLTGFDVGINNVPYDMPAYLHAGESVIPSEFNPFNPNAVSPLSLTPATNNVVAQQDNSDIIEENKLLRQELQAQNGAMVRLLSKVARVVERWDGDGLPEPRTETA